MDTRELQAAIHQAVIDGDTEMVKRLNITLRRMSSSTQAIDVSHQTILRSAEVSDRPQGNPQQVTISISALICFVVLPYWAVAEVLNPGHQGLMKFNQAHWFWGPKLVLAPLKGFAPKIKLPTPSISELPKAESKAVVRAPEDVLLTCGDQDGNPFVKFTLSNVDFWIYSVEVCQPGVVKKGADIATLTRASFMETSDQGKTARYDRTQLEEFFGG